LGEGIAFGAGGKVRSAVGLRLGQIAWKISLTEVLGLVKAQIGQKNAVNCFPLEAKRRLSSPKQLKRIAVS